MENESLLNFQNFNPFNLSIIDRAEYARSKNKPVIISELVGRGYLLLEYGMIKGINGNRGTEWELKERTIFMYRQRVIEQVKIKVQSKDRKAKVQEESYFFDITSVMHQLLNDSGFDFDLGDNIFRGEFGLNPNKSNDFYEAHRLNEEVIWSTNKSRMDANTKRD